MSCGRFRETLPVRFPVLTSSLLIQISGRTPRLSHPDRHAHKQASQKGHTESHHLTPLRPPPQRPSTHRDRPLRNPRPALAPRGHRPPGDGGDGGVHLVAHESCKLDHVWQVLRPLVCAMWLRCGGLSRMWPLGAHR